MSINKYLLNVGEVVSSDGQQKLSSEGFAQVPLRVEQQASSADNWQSK